MDATDDSPKHTRLDWRMPAWSREGSWSASKSNEAANRPFIEATEPSRHRTLMLESLSVACRVPAPRLQDVFKNTGTWAQPLN